MHFARLSNRIVVTVLTAVTVALALALALPHQLEAQAQAPWRTVRQNDHVWLAVTYDQPVSKHWAVLGDIQWRRTDGLSKPQQFMFRNTLTYKLADGLRLGGGVNYGASAPYGELPSARPVRDHQLFLFAQMNQRPGKFDLMHRYRYEHRWLSDIITDEDGDRSRGPSRYQQRARYLLRAAYPVPGLKYRTRDVTAVLQNDVFVGISHTDRGLSLDQNRFSFGTGIPLSATKRLDVLWLQQWIAHPARRASENNGTVWILLNHIGRPR
jgi:hypothetical protein